LKKSPRKSTGKIENPLIEIMSSGQAKWKTEIFGQIPFLLTFPKNLTTRFEPLKKSPRKSTGKIENPLVEKVSSGQAKWKTEIFGQSSAPPHFLQNWVTKFEPLKKS
jgi:hypothetical protein